jgi:hypothetical protein
MLDVCRWEVKGIDEYLPSATRLLNRMRNHWIRAASSALRQAAGRRENKSKQRLSQYEKLESQ